MLVGCVKECKVPEQLLYYSVYFSFKVDSHPDIQGEMIIKHPPRENCCDCNITR
jgi:hypothetical protein